MLRCYRLPNDDGRTKRPEVAHDIRHLALAGLEISDGGCVLHLWVSEPLEMQPWIRSWGAQVEVIAPDWLRERIADELRQAGEQYRTPIQAVSHETKTP